MSLSALITEFRQSYARNPGLNEIGDSALTGCVRDALREFSRYSPRRNRRAQVLISTGDKAAKLPVDFLAASAVELWKLYSPGSLIPSGFRTVKLSVLGPGEWRVGNDTLTLTVERLRNGVS